MILSRYCKIYSHDEDPYSVVLFSTKTASTIVIPKAMLLDIEKNTVSKEEKETLTELGFCVNAEEETKEMLGFISELNLLKKTFGSIVAMNLDCNLACRYCFEGSRKGKLYLTKETAGQFVDFVKTRVGQDTEGISITFYGGEPFLSLDLVICISGALKAFAESTGRIYDFSFITNGTLLTPETVKKLKPYGLKSASVTLDGPKEVHDYFRPFRSGRGSFSRIFENLKDVCCMMDIQVGGNFTRSNYTNFPKLLDYMLENGLTPDQVSFVRFDPVNREVEGIAQPDFHDGCSSINEPWLFEAGLFLREEIMKRGFRTDKISPSTCMMDFNDSMVINYDGSIYKCPGLIGREQYKAGDITSGIEDYRQSHNLDNWKNQECLACAYLPLCFGGCRYMMLVREGNMDGIDCKKPYFDACLAELVKQDIKYGLV
jgi:uncharacterized protein